MKRRAVITGIGIVAPSGIGKEAFWKCLSEGRSCTKRITHFDPVGFPCKVAGEVPDFDPSVFIRPKELRHLTRTAQLAIPASILAMEDADLLSVDLSSSRTAILIGTAAPAHDMVENNTISRYTSGVKHISPYFVCEGHGGALSSHVSITLNLHHLSHTITTGCTSSSDALGYALNLIRAGYDVVISGGVEAPITPTIVGGFCQIRTATTRFNNNAKSCMRPFCKDRDGFALAEGAWIFVIEEFNVARRRGAHMYAELMGYGATCGAYHMVRPHPSGNFTMEAIFQALNDAGCHAEDIDYFSAYGNATKINDSYETMVIKKVFGAHAYELSVSSVKSMLGHPLGASGALQLASCIFAKEYGLLPPTINYIHPDPECDLDYVSNTSRPAKVKFAMCNTIAFGSKNAAIVVNCDM